MKTKLILICLMTLSKIALAQFIYHGPTSVATASYLGVNMPSASTEFNLQVNGSIGMKYGSIFGVTNTGWPTAQTRIFQTGWDLPNSDFLAFFTPGNSGAINALEKMRITNNGNVGIGVSTPLAKLHIAHYAGIALEIDHLNSTTSWDMAAVIKVHHDESRALMIQKVTGGTANTIFQIWGTGVVNAKTIFAEGITVTLGAIGIAWPDYVFKKGYSLMPLGNLETYIQKNHHLPNVPSASEIQKDGANLGELVRVQMEKIEELTLYILELNKKMEALQAESKK